jgi:hypothetical protein
MEDDQKPKMNKSRLNINLTQQDMGKVRTLCLILKKSKIGLISMLLEEKMQNLNLRSLNDDFLIRYAKREE